MTVTCLSLSKSFIHEQRNIKLKKIEKMLTLFSGQAIVLEDLSNSHHRANCCNRRYLRKIQSGFLLVETWIRFFFADAPASASSSSCSASAISSPTIATSFSSGPSSSSATAPALTTSSTTCSSSSLTACIVSLSLAAFLSRLREREREGKDRSERRGEGERLRVEAMYGRWCRSRESRGCPEAAVVISSALSSIDLLPPRRASLCIVDVNFSGRQDPVDEKGPRSRLRGNARIDLRLHPRVQNPWMGSPPSLLSSSSFVPNQWKARVPPTRDWRALLVAPSSPAGGPVVRGKWKSRIIKTGD
uniref:Uncharacterized protein n=1 Tax=Oryza nivara TaxID=4536 RepID=A0A0E0GID3_ORYNI